ncbi:hypothetical protein CLCR_02669 [Cladophialophora carrionii]|uniref:Uncharacterized protein n=1 Tax=Cladophialophora carrionii TaxID=86049 RepID=A0A1C1CFD6_9EURO|nr:hypothetical protein CLCR_02669 [Cladophialophora carrionii]
MEQAPLSPLAAIAAPTGGTRGALCDRTLRRQMYESTQEAKLETYRPRSGVTTVVNLRAQETTPNRQGQEAEAEKGKARPDVSYACKPHARSLGSWVLVGRCAVRDASKREIRSRIRRENDQREKSVIVG